MVISATVLGLLIEPIGYQHQGHASPALTPRPVMPPVTEPMAAWAPPVKAARRLLAFRRTRPPPGPHGVYTLGRSSSSFLTRTDERHSKQGITPDTVDAFVQSALHFNSIGSATWYLQ